MKFSLNIFVKNVVNVCVYQKGWNYIQLRFLNGTVSLAAIEQFALTEGSRDPYRFFDNTTQFNYDEETQTLTFPAIRIEFYEQLIQIHKLFSFIVLTNNNVLQIEQQIRFMHYPKGVPSQAPPIDQCKVVYKKYIQLNNFKIPGLQFFEQVFSEIHFAKLEQMFVWMGINSSEDSNILMASQEMLFQQLFGQNFSNCLAQLKNAHNLTLISGQLLELNICNQLRQIIDISTLKDINKAYKNHATKLFDISNISALHSYEEQHVDSCNQQQLQDLHLSVVQQINSSCSGDRDDRVLGAAQMHFSTQGQNDMLATEGSVHSTTTDDLDEVAPGSRFQNTGEIDVKQELPIQDSLVLQTAVEIRQNTKTISILNFDRGTRREVLPLAFLRLVEHTPTNFDELLMAANASVQRYTECQLAVLKQQQSDIHAQVQQFHRFRQIIDRVRGAIDRKYKSRAFVFVHGYKGSRYDFKFFKDILKMKMQHVSTNQQNYYMILDYSYMQNTQLLEIGNQMLNQLRRSIVSQFKRDSYEQCLSCIDEINFVGFSMGNVVIESILSQVEVQGLEYEAMCRFNQKYGNVSAADLDCAAVMREAQNICRDNQLLLKLNRYFCINGPVMGQTKTNGLVNMGMGFLKVFSKGKVNICLSELGCQMQSRRLIEPLVVKINYLKQLYNYGMKEGVQVTKFCSKELVTQLDSNSFREFCVMDILAFNSKLPFFRQLVLLGSHRDGYVNFESAMGVVRQAFQGYLAEKYRHCTDVVRYVIKNDSNKFRSNRSLDKTTGRCVHLCPLVDFETIDGITNLVIKHSE